MERKTIETMIRHNQRAKMQQSYHISCVNHGDDMCPRDMI